VTTGAGSLVEVVTVVEVDVDVLVVVVVGGAVDSSAPGGCEEKPWAQYQPSTLSTGNGPAPGPAGLKPHDPPQLPFFQYDQKPPVSQQ
jgi:hypothetical protein